MEQADQISTIILELLHTYFGDVVEKGELGLVSYGPQEAYLIAGNFALEFRYYNQNLGVNYIDAGPSQELRAYSLDSFLSERVLPSDCKMVSDFPEGSPENLLEICFARLMSDTSELWSGQKDWLQEAWIGEAPGEPISSSLKIAWNLL